MFDEHSDDMPDAAIPVSPFKWRVSFQWDWLVTLRKREDD